MFYRHNLQRRAPFKITHVVVAHGLHELRDEEEERVGRVGAERAHRVLMRQRVRRKHAREEGEGEDGRHGCPSEDVRELRRGGAWREAGSESRGQTLK